MLSFKYSKKPQVIFQYLSFLLMTNLVAFETVRLEAEGKPPVSHVKIRLPKSSFFLSLLLHFIIHLEGMF